LPLWLKYIGATARGTLNVSEATSLTGLVEKLDFDGRVETGLELMLVPNENIKLKAWALSPAMNVKLGKLLSVKSLKTNLNLTKDYRIITEEEIKAKQSKIVPLSVRVLRDASEPVAGSSSAFAAEDTAVTKFTGALQNRFGTQHAIAFKSAYIGLGPLPLSIDHSVIDFDLNKGLPISDYFKVELLGGTVIGSVAVLQKNDRFFLQTRLAFSGLNTEKIYPPAGAKDNDDSELSGRLWALIPLSSQMNTLMQEIQMDLNLSRIGTRSLERFLYALDPSESNEAIVSQRRLLRLGSPRWINVYVKDGSLSMEGEVDAQGVPVAIPSLRRLHIANVTGLDNYDAYLASLDPLIAVLKICAATGIKISKDGKHFKFQTTTSQ
jgi:translocation and assembly module TamB